MLSYAFADICTMRRYIMQAMITSVMCILLLNLIHGTSYADTPQSRYEQLKDAVERLKSDERHANWREPWQKLAAGFTALASKHPTWNNRAAAIFRSAECYEELSQRSYLKADREYAAQAYIAMAEQFPLSVLADDALLCAARLYAGPLCDVETAQSILAQLLQLYPQGDMRFLAKDLQKQYRAFAAKKPTKGITKKSLQKSKWPLLVENAQKAKQNRSDVRKKTIKTQSNKAPFSTIFIDAGHGGHDPGTLTTSGTYILEKNITLEVARQLGHKLKSLGWRVIYSRKKDKAVSLGDRVALANASKADIFISLHINASHKHTTNGFETYIAASLARTQCIMHKRINNNDRHDDSQKKKAAPRAHTLARHIQQQTIRHLRTQGFSVKNGGIRPASFHVLTKTAMPSVLIEMGYISNTKERHHLMMPAYRKRLVEGIAMGIMQFKS